MTKPALPYGSPGDPDFYINKGAMEGVIKSAHNIADDIGDEAKVGQKDSEPAASAHQGWEISPALTGCLQNWEINVKGLSDQVREVGDRLQSTVDSSTATDEESAARIGGAGHYGPGGVYAQ